MEELTKRQEEILNYTRQYITLKPKENQNFGCFETGILIIKVYKLDSRLKVIISAADNAEIELSDSNSFHYNRLV